MENKITKNETIDSKEGQQNPTTIDDIIKDFDRIDEVKRVHILGVAQGINLGYSMANTIKKKSEAS